MAIINPTWEVKQVGSFQTSEEMNNLADAVKSNAIELQTDISNLQTHINNEQNPHSVTKEQVGLDKVDNVSDVNKPISTATQTALNGKVNNTGDETIAGVKTLSSSPIVPTPTTDMQASTKKYVDDAIINLTDDIQGNTTETIATLNTTLNSHTNDLTNPHKVTKTQIGLSHVDDTSDLEKPISTAVQTALNLKEDWSNKGAINGYAGLDETGKIPSTQLPSYVDDVLEYANLDSFPVFGESGKIYIALDTNKTYRWSGSTYVYITSGAVDSVAGKTGVVTLTKSDVGLPNVDNTSDTSKPISTATQIALDLKADKARQIISGAGITGGGDLSTDRTLSVVSANDGITVNVDNIQLNTVDNVTSTSTTKPLAANQGKVLNDNLVQLGAEMNENIEPSLAEILNAMAGRIIALESIIKNSVYKNMQVDTLDIVKGFSIYGSTNLVLTGTAAPSVVPDFVGQFYVNTTGGVCYQAKGISSTSDWKQTSN